MSSRFSSLFIGYFGAMPLVPPFDNDQNVRAGQHDSVDHWKLNPHHRLKAEPPP